MSRSSTWMPLYVGDYLADTTHLEAEGHGAYLLLLMTCWKRGGTLPDDDSLWQSIARLPAQRWKVLKPTLREFFAQEADGTWSQKRLAKELGRARHIAEQRSAAGKDGNAKRWQTPSQNDRKIVANGVAKPSQTPSVCDPQPQSTQESLLDSSCSSIEEGKNANNVISGVVGALRARGAARKVDFSQPENRQAYARQRVAEKLGWETVMAAFHAAPGAPRDTARKAVAAEARRQRLTLTFPVPA